ncbi:hypothetical protein B4Q13_20775, partial [Lacticaseibacillus rhamnosus]
MFTEREKAALDYTAAVMRTPVEVTDELFAQVKEHFTDEQLVRHHGTEDQARQVQVFVGLQRGGEWGDNAADRHGV